MIEFNIYSDSFRGARYTFNLLEKLLNEKQYKFHITKFGDKFVLEMDDFKLNFLSLTANRMINILEERELALFKRNSELESSIRKHRDQKLDDRCFLDDQELYKILNEPIPENYNAIPPINKMLENCKRYLEKRCNPDEKWKTYQELENEILQLKEENQKLKLLK